MIGFIILLLKLYAAGGFAFLIVSWFYDKNYQNTPEEQIEEDRVWEEMKEWSWGKMALEMTFMYLVIFIIWPRFAYEVYQEFQSRRG